ncbi:MAG: DUF2089 domain-containing protein [Vallitaleaceae bacterium]|jgi:hypothetical protein|nr:DUF2089 domain-containing protein [Vallitaleaceae bacterium]
MRYKAPGLCPVCSEKLAITKLSCPKCATNIEGDFQPCEFCRLPNDELDFIKVFIKNRGNIKDVEKELGISYPTVRAKLDTVITSLGFVAHNQKDIDDMKAAKEKQKNEILNQLSQGVITAKEATEAIKVL